MRSWPLASGTATSLGVARAPAGWGRGRWISCFRRPPGGRPTRVDYVYRAVTTATVFSATATRPRIPAGTRAARVPALISLITVALVAARRAYVNRKGTALRCLRLSPPSLPRAANC